MTHYHSTSVSVTVKGLLKQRNLLTYLRR